MVAHNVGAVSRQASENSSYQMNVSTHVLSEKEWICFLLETFSFIVRRRLEAVLQFIFRKTLTLKFDCRSPFQRSVMSILRFISRYSYERCSISLVRRSSSCLPLFCFLVSNGVSIGKHVESCDEVAERGYTKSTVSF